MEKEKIVALKNNIQTVLGDISRMIYYFRGQQIYRGVSVGQRFWQDVSVVVETLSIYLPVINGDDYVVDLNEILVILQNLQEAQENQDYVLLADMYELQMMPILISIEERLMGILGISIDENLLWRNISVCYQKNPQLLYSLLPEQVVQECITRDSFSDEAIDTMVLLVEQCFGRGCTVEPTSSGFLTMAMREDGHQYYIHTNGQIVAEAMHQAEEWLTQGKEKYTFYGMGMGYPYLEMLELDCNISIRVIEMNREMLILAMIFAPIGELFASNRFELIYDPTGHRLEHMTLEIGEDDGFYILYSTLHGVRKEHLRRQLEEYFVNESSIRIHSRNLNGNFKKNSKLNCGNINDLQKYFKDREVIIVAAGPSLDQNINELKKRSQGTVLVAVGTVLRKLLKEDIRPDYTIIIDSGKPVYSQIEGVEDCGVPLIFLSTVFSWITRDYQGKKYMLCQKDFAPAEVFAQERNWELVETGGSVVTTALDMCLRMQVKKIIFAGLDLAYTNGMNHAGDTAYVDKVVKDTGVMVDAIGGGKVQTGKTLKIYLDWIENRIARRSGREQEIRIIDATEGGAKKKGMEVMALREALAEKQTN